MLEQIVERAKAGTPQEIGKYCLTGYIGEGGIFYVLKAHKKAQPSETIALKIPKDLKQKEELRKHKDILTRLKHHNLPEILDSDLEADIPYVAEQFIQGKTLAEIIAEHRQAGTFIIEDTALKIGRSVLDALSYMHSRGVFHCDVKPPNILVAESRTYLTDFNIARQTTRTGVANTLTMQTASKTHSRAFTDLYASPEQRAGLPIDARSDIYSFAVTLFEMLTNQPLLGSDTNPAQFNTKLKKDYTGVFTRATKTRAEDRFNTIDDLRKALFEGEEAKQEQILVKYEPKVPLAQGHYGGGLILLHDGRSLFAYDLNAKEPKLKRVYRTNKGYKLVDVCVQEGDQYIQVLEGGLKTKPFYPGADDCLVNPLRITTIPLDLCERPKISKDYLLYDILFWLSNFPQNISATSTKVIIWNDPETSNAVYELEYDRADLRLCIQPPRPVFKDRKSSQSPNKEYKLMRSLSGPVFITTSEDEPTHIITRRKIVGCSWFDTAKPVDFPRRDETWYKPWNYVMNWHDEHC
ncbi:serine/threonine protein kinase [Candidatus Woesearchaeota archaeon]|nr:serine/threonine protein kinase [Candidatus Woesearchaeota archaeon]